MNKYFMSVSPGHSPIDPVNLPEPSFDELYRLYVEFKAYHRKGMMADAVRYLGDIDLEEFIAKKEQPISEESFRRYLDQLTEEGVREIFVNRMVLGPRYCEEHRHGEDKRIQLPPKTPEAIAERVAKLNSWLLRAMRNIRPDDSSPPR